MENPSKAAWPHGGNFFILFLISTLEEELNLQTAAQRKPPCITEIWHGRPAVPSCQTQMRGFTAGGTTEYRTAITRSRDGEEMEGGFSIEKPTAPGSCCHFETSSAAQEGPIVQRFADGYIAVIGHDGDGSGVPQGIGHGFGHRGGDGAQVKNREVEEEEVHGGVEAVVTGYSSDDEAIAQEDSHVDAQEEPEVQELQIPPCVHERQEEELGDGAAVGHLLTLCKGPGQGGKVSDK
ncbi:hypothetical protein QYF61_007037 [Mycteria americana]|uniref:Uncharacterized protein n=1 Tax=Mycteria americana TaxID=33587 RepID=A0AAN7RK41_MYCAM|nr:hypothetical protein QYF61_007037 [Mycteria americana]